MRRTTVALVSLFLALTGPVSLLAQSALPGVTATVPRLMQVSGLFQPADAQTASAVEVVTVSIYAEPDGGLPVWQERQSVAIEKTTGRFTLLLGASYPDGIPAEVFASGDGQWMSLLFERAGEREQPRVRIASVPYALKASDSETLGGLPASAYVRSPAVDAASDGGHKAVGSVTGADASVGIAAVLPGTTNFLAKYVNGTDIGTSVIYDSGGAVGIGTTAPFDQLHLRLTNTNGVFTGLAVQNLGNTAASYSGMMFYDQFGALAQFQGFNNVTHEYRVNNIAASGSINLMLGSTSRLFVAPSGNVGIGTNVPGSKLDVNGSANFNGHVNIAGFMDLGALGTNPNVRLSVGGANATTSIETAPVMQLSRPAQSGIKNTNSVGFSVGAFETGILGRTRLDIKLAGLPTDSNTYGTIPDVTVMSMQADGNVGIGTTNPASRLEVKDGNAAITNGALKITGAGANTNTAVFIHVVTNASHTCGAAQTIIDNPYTNNDPNAILIVTQSAGTTDPFTPVAEGAFFLRYGDQNVGCALFGGLNRWMIYSFGTLPVGSRFNVMVIKP